MSKSVKNLITGTMFNFFIRSHIGFWYFLNINCSIRIKLTMNTCKFNHNSTTPWYRKSSIHTKARRWVPPHNTQCLQNSAKSGKRKCLNTRLPDFPLPTLLYRIRREAKKYSNLQRKSEIFWISCLFTQYVFNERASLSSEGVCLLPTIYRV